ncbi:MAG: efflux RND transporter periplasmic adaptor subunit [Halanaerobiaceae bacterium]
MKKIIIIIVLIAVLAGGFVLATRDSGEEAVSGPARLVNIIEAEKDTLITSVSADGKALPELEKELKASLNGVVETLYVERGSLVNEGEQIYSLDDSKLQRSLETAKLDLQEVEANYQDILDNYNKQDKRNDLRLEESRRNLEIQLLSYQNEENTLKEQKADLENQVEESKENMEKVQETLEEHQILYESDAIAYNTLKEYEDSYKQAKRRYEKAESDYITFIDKTMPNSLELAQLKVENARNHLESLESSIEAEKITTKDLELAENKVKRVKSQIRDIESDLAKINAYAPITGTVIELGVEEGDTIVEGNSLARIADLNTFIIEAMVDEIHINSVETGQEVKINSDSFDEELEGVVEFIAPSGSQVGNLNKYQVDIVIADDSGLLRADMRVDAEIITMKKDNVITVPSLAILGEDEKHLFVVNDGKAEKRIVETGLKSLGQVEISGVEAGEKIIIGPYTILTDLEDGIAVRDANN